MVIFTNSKEVYKQYKIILRLVREKKMDKSLRSATAIEDINRKIEIIRIFKRLIIKN